MTSGNILKKKNVFDYTYSRFTKITYADLAPYPLEQILGGIWGAVSRSEVLFLPQWNNFKLLYCAFFWRQFYDDHEEGTQNGLLSFTQTLSGTRVLVLEAPFTHLPSWRVQMSWVSLSCFSYLPYWLVILSCILWCIAGTYLLPVEIYLGLGVEKEKLKSTWEYPPRRKMLAVFQLNDMEEYPPRWKILEWWETGWKISGFAQL